MAMSPALILPPELPIYAQFKRLVQSQRALMFAGVPGVGKSLMLQQAAHLAHASGRVLHQMQWDVSRTAFELHPYVLARYPEVDGVTHPMVRKAVGMWARQALLDWHQAHPHAEHLLLGELPLIGNRFIELVQHRTDEVEALLAAPEVKFVVPAPSKEIRAAIEKARAASIANPRDDNEKWDAPPNVLQMLWDDVYQMAVRTGITNDIDPTYSPDVYLGAFDALLVHRNTEHIYIDMHLKPTESAYILPPIASELKATPDEVEALIKLVETTWTVTEVSKMVATWYVV